MKHSHKIYVPSSHEQGILSRMARRFGGATMYACTGAWEDEHGDLVTEPISVIESKAENPDWPWLKALAWELQTVAKQDCVAIEVDGNLKFIGGKGDV